MSAEKDARAASLFLGSLSIEQIKQQCQFRDVRSAEAAVHRGLAALGRGKDRDMQLGADVERLDMLFRALYPKALKGDLGAVEKCARLIEQRQRLLGRPDTPEDGVLAAFERTVAALALRPEDEALVESGRTFARQVDYAVRHLTGADVTKALYLLPHIINVLRELGATPAARAEVTAAAKAPPVDELAAFREVHGLKG